MFIDSDSANASANRNRNRFAHTRGFEPDENLVNQLLADLRNMDSPFFMSYVDGNDRELAYALASVCGHLERVVQERKSLQSNEDN